MDAQSDRHVFHSTIEKWTKVGEGINGYIVYDIVTEEIANQEPIKKYHVSRRFSNFVSLHEKLIETCGRKGCFLPAVPEKDFMGNTRVILNMSKNQSISSEFVERRKTVLERYLNRIGRHPIVNADLNFLQFIRSDIEYDPESILFKNEQNNTPNQEGNQPKSNKGHRGSLTSPTYAIGRAIGLVTGTISKLRSRQSKFGESDEWFKALENDTNEYLEGFRNMSRTVNQLATNRKEAVSAIDNFRLSVQMQSNAEENTALCHGLTFASDALENYKVENEKLFEFEQQILVEYAKDYAGYCTSIKSALNERASVKLSLLNAVSQNAKNQTPSREAAKVSEVKIERQDDTDGLDSEETGACAELRSKLDDISNSIRMELIQFDKQRCEDFRSSMISYLESYRAYYLEMENVWKELCKLIEDTRQRSR